VRGFRIELEEIEAILWRHPAVRECAVAAREADGGGKQLVAYVAPVPGTELRGGELRSLAASALPEYMVPRVKILPAGLPHTVGGKVDRARLAALADTDPEPVEPPALPRTPMEEQVAAVWRELLGTAHFGVHDDFFELGGHSLMATQVVARLRDRFQIQLPLIALFETPTIAGLAARIPQARKSGAAQPATRGADAQIA